MNILRFWTRVLRYVVAQPLLPLAPARRQPIVRHASGRQAPVWETPAYLRKLRSGDRAWMRY
jgi:hypothetical protein